MAEVNSEQGERGISCYLATHRLEVPLKKQRRIMEKTKAMEKVREGKSMECGHAANSILSIGNNEWVPACVFCYPDKKATLIADKPPNLTNRKAQCPYCKRTVQSELTLPFFEHRPGEYDSYYCGCRGWD